MYENTRYPSNKNIEQSSRVKSLYLQLLSGVKMNLLVQSSQFPIPCQMLAVVNSTNTWLPNLNIYANQPNASPYITQVDQIPTILEMLKYLPQNASS